MESEQISDKSHKSTLKDFDEDKILQNKYEYKFNKTNPFYRKIDLNEYIDKTKNQNNFKQLILSLIHI